MNPVEVIFWVIVLAVLFPVPFIFLAQVIVELLAQRRLRIEWETRRDK